MKDHQHTWKRDKTRTHKRPPRFFVICTDQECGARSQAVMKYGFISTFNTHKPSNVDLVKGKPLSIRLSKIDEKMLNDGQAVIVFADNRLQLQYNY